MADTRSKSVKRLATLGMALSMPLNATASRANSSSNQFVLQTTTAGGHSRINPTNIGVSQNFRPEFQSNHQGAANTFSHLFNQSGNAHVTGGNAPAQGHRGTPSTTNVTAFTNGQGSVSIGERFLAGEAWIVNSGASKNAPTNSGNRAGNQFQSQSSTAPSTQGGGSGSTSNSKGTTDSNGSRHITLANSNATSTGTSQPKGVQLDLTSSNADVTLSQKIFGSSSSVIINVGGQQTVLKPGDKVSAAEYVAAVQVLDGTSQSLLVDSTGKAAGGTFSLNTLANRSGSIVASELVIPQSVTAVDNVSTASTLRITGDLVNNGSIDAISSNSKATTGNLIAIDITNSASGVIGTQPNSTSSSAAPIDLNLSATQNFSNAGSITSNGALTIASGGTLTNSNSAGSTAALIKGDGAVTLQASNITNSGIIKSVNDNINVQSQSNITINDTGGTFAAANGDINIRDASFSQTANTTLNGGDYLSKNLNVYSGTGDITGSIGVVSGQLNTAGMSAELYTATPVLTLGDSKIIEDPTYVNSAGSINITGTVSVGEALTIIARDNITSTVGSSITANNGTSGFNISLIAGANVTSPVNSAGNITVTGSPPAPPNPPAANTVAATINGTQPASSGGGSILLDGTTINAQGVKSGGAGGSVFIAALAGSSAGANGIVNLAANGDISTINTSGNGAANGNVTIFAGGTGTSGAPSITTGNITASGGTSGGTITINTVQAKANGSADVKYAATGALSSGSLVAGTAASGGGFVLVDGTVQSGTTLAVTSNGGIGNTTGVGGGLLQSGTTTTLTTTAGDIGGTSTATAINLISTGNLTVTSAGNAFISAQGPITLGVSSAGNSSTFSLSTTAPGASGKITANSINAETINLSSSDGTTTGGIAHGGGTLTANTINLTDNSGTGAQAITATTAASNLSASTNGAITLTDTGNVSFSSTSTGTVALTNTGTVNLLSSTADKFTVTTKQTTDSINISGTINATTSITLDASLSTAAANAITQSNTGLLEVATGKTITLKSPTSTAGNIGTSSQRIELASSTVGGSLTVTALGGGSIYLESANNISANNTGFTAPGPLLFDLRTSLGSGASITAGAITASAASGSIVLTADGSGSIINGNTLTANSVTLNSGSGSIGSAAAIKTATSNLTVNTTGSATVSDSLTGTTAIQNSSVGGNFTLSDVGNVSVQGTLTGTNSSTIAITSSSFDITGGAIKTGTGTVTLAPTTVANLITIGTTGASYVVSAASLSGITAGQVNIGKSGDTGGILVTDAVNMSSAPGTAGSYNLSLTSTGTGTFDSSAGSFNIGANNLTIGSGGVTTLGAVTGTTGNLTVTTSANNSSITVVGNAGTTGGATKLQANGTGTINGGEVIGNSVTLISTSGDIGSSGGVQTQANSLTFSTSGNVTINDTGSGLTTAILTSSIGSGKTLNLTDNQGIDIQGTLTTNGAAKVNISAGGDFQISTGAITSNGAANISILSSTVSKISGSITTTNTGSVSFAPTNTASAITIDANGTSPGYVISSTELAQIKTGTVSIGNTNDSGNIKVTTDLNLSGTKGTTGGAFNLVLTNTGSPGSGTYNGSANTFTLGTQSLTINSGSSASLGAVASGAAVTVNAGGAITTGANTLVATAVSLSTTLGDIGTSSASAQTQTSNLTLNTPGNAFVNDTLAGTTTIKTGTIGGNLTLSDVAADTISGTLTIGGDLSLSSGGVVSVAGALNGSSSSALAITSSGFSVAGSVNTSTGILALAPINQLATMAIGTGSTYNVTAASLLNVVAGTVTIGNSNDSGNFTVNQAVTEPVGGKPGTDKGSFNLGITTTGKFTTTAAGTISLDAQSLTVNAGGAASIGGNITGTNSSTIAITSASLAFTGTATINTQKGTVVLAPFDPSVQITLGSNPSGYVISTAAGGALSKITAGTVTIGNASDFGNIIVNSTVNLAGTPGTTADAFNLSLTTTKAGTFDGSAGSFTNGDQSLTINSGGLAKIGPVSGANGSLTVNTTTGAISVGGAVSFTGTSTVLLNSGAGISNSAPIAATNVTLQTANAGSILANANIGEAGGTTKLLADTTGTISGTGSVIGGTVTLSSGSGDIGVGTPLLTKADNLAVSTTGNASLSDSSSGATTNILTSSVGGNFTLADTQGVSIVGTLSGTNASTISITSSSIGFGATGALNTGTGTVDLAPTDPSANITIGTSASGYVVSPDTLSKITAATLNIGNNSDFGNITVNTAVTSAGTPGSAPGAYNLSLTTTGNGTYDGTAVGASFSIGANSLTINSGKQASIGPVSGTTGTFTVNTTTGDIAVNGAVSFTVPGSIVAFNSGGNITNSATIGGGNVTLQTLSNGNITIGNSIGSGLGSAVHLIANGKGTIDETAGAFLVNTGLLTLSSGSGNIGVLGPLRTEALGMLVSTAGSANIDNTAFTGQPMNLGLSTVGSLTLSAGSSIQIINPVSVTSNLTLTSNGSISVGFATGGSGATVILNANGTGGISGAGTLTGSSIQLTSAATGGINLTTNTGSLTVASGGSTTINNIATTPLSLGTSTGGSQFTLTNAGEIDTIGSVSATHVTLTAASGKNIVVGSAVGLTGGSTILNTSGVGAITEAAGGLVQGSSVTLNGGSGGIGVSGTPLLTSAASVLTVNTSGSAFVDNSASTSSLTMGNSAVSGEYSLVTGGTVTANTISTPDLVLATQNGGSISLFGQVGAAGGTVVLNANGAGSINTTTQILADTVSATSGNGTINNIKTAATSLQLNTGGNASDTNSIGAGTVSLGSSTVNGTLTLNASGGINVTGSVSGGTINLNTTGNSGNILVSNTLGSTTGTTNLTTNGSGSINTSGSGIIQGNSVVLKSTSGIIGTTPLITSAGTLTVNTGGSANIDNSAMLSNLNLGASTVGSSLTLITGGALTVTATVTSPTLSLSTENSGNILLNSFVGQAGGSTTLTAGGTGSITNAVGSFFIRGASVSLSSSGGDIGAVGTALRTSTNNLTANTSGTGIVNISNGSITGAVTLGDSTSGGSFQVSSVGPLTVNNISTVNGNLTVQATSGSLAVTAGKTITSNGGNVLLQNLNTATGSISIGDGATVQGLAGPGFGNVTIVIGAVPGSPQTTTTPANITETIVGPGQIFYGKNGIVATGPTNAQVEAQGANVIFNTGSLAASVITLGSGTVINADPPVSATSSTDSPNAQSLVVLATQSSSGMFANNAITNTLSVVTTSSQVSSAVPSASMAPNTTGNSISLPGIATNLASIESSSINLSPTEVRSGASFTPSLDQVLQIASPPMVSMPLSGQISTTVEQSAITNDKSPSPGAHHYSTVEAMINAADDTVDGTVWGVISSNESSSNVSSPEGSVRVVARTISDNRQHVTMADGNVLFLPTKDTVVETPHGSIAIDAKSAVMIIVAPKHVAIFDLHDQHANAVSVNTGSGRFLLAPGKQASVVSGDIAEFAPINPSDMIGYRRMTRQVVGGRSVFTSDFSIGSAICAFKPLKQLVLSENTAHMQIANKLAKTAGILIQVSGAAEPYRQIMRPRMTALK